MDSISVKLYGDTSHVKAICKMNGLSGLPRRNRLLLLADGLRPALRLIDRLGQRFERILNRLHLIRLKRYIIKILPEIIRYLCGRMHWTGKRLFIPTGMGPDRAAEILCSPVFHHLARRHSILPARHNHIILHVRVLLIINIMPAHLHEFPERNISPNRVSWAGV